MPNNLTGEFDVIAQFAVPAANRVLAAMHQRERFPHSATFRVDDTPPPFGEKFWPPLVGLVNAFGDAVTNQQRIGRPAVLPGIRATTNSAYSLLDAVVNLNGAALEEITADPSNLQGRAQVQLFPPTIEFADSTGSRVAIRLELLARYFPDPKTTQIAEFVRGVLRVTAPVNQVASQVANAIEIDIKAASIGVNFTATWSSKPLSQADYTSINLLIRNALRTSFLPSTSALPPNISHMQFKTIPGGVQAIAVLLDMDGGPGNSATATTVFLDGGDDFAFGVGADFVRAAFQPTLDKILSTPVEPARFTLSTPFNSWTITYTFKLNSAAVELENGKLVLVVKGRATTGSWTPNFNFTAKLSFSLEVNGDTADLVPGDISIDTSSWIIDRFRSRATSTIRRARDAALAQGGARDAVRKMLSADKNLGGFIDSLLQPARGSSAPPLPKGFQLAYTSVRISPDGIVLHGSLSVTPWPAPHVEFEQIPVDGGDRFVEGTVPQGADYTALKSWIPGGTIDRYEWKPMRQTQPGYVDANRFVYLYQRPGVSVGMIETVPFGGYNPLCLTVYGRRLSWSGPVVEEPVKASACAFDTFPILDAVAGLGESLPMIALVQPGPRGLVEIGGHTVARVGESGRVPPNLIVHFGTLRSAANLVPLVAALRNSGRTDAPTAILAVLAREDLENVVYTPDVIYAEDQEGKWEHQFGVKIERRPATLVVSPQGKTVHQQEGEIDVARFAEVLRETLTRGGRMKPMLKPPSLRIGSAPPNFLFPYDGKREQTLRKIAPKESTVVFWRSASKQSIEMVSELDAAQRDSKGDRVLFAINDGDEPDLANRIATEKKWSAVVVPDRERRISLAYGVMAWPTVIELDARGAVAGFSVGRFNFTAEGATGRV